MAFLSMSVYAQSVLEFFDENLKGRTLNLEARGGLEHIQGDLRALADPNDEDYKRDFFNFGNQIGRDGEDKEVVLEALGDRIGTKEGYEKAKKYFERISKEINKVLLSDGLPQKRLRLATRFYDKLAALALAYSRQEHPGVCSSVLNPWDYVTSRLKRRGWLPVSSPQSA